MIAIEDYPFKVETVIQDTFVAANKTFKKNYSFTISQ